MFRSRCGRISTKTSRSFSSMRRDCPSVFSSEAAGVSARLPAHKSRFYGYPDKSNKECIFWCSGHGRWCFECCKNAHAPVPIPTPRHSPPRCRASTHKIDSGRLCRQCSERAHTMPAYTTRRVSLGFCKNETNTHSVGSSRERVQCSKCARSSAPTFPHRHAESHGIPPAHSRCASRHREVERGQAARCDQRAPRLERCKHGVVFPGHRGSRAAVLSWPEPGFHSTSSYSRRRVVKASRGIGMGAEHYKERLFATIRSTSPPLYGACRDYGEIRSISSTSSRDSETTEQRGHRTRLSGSERRGLIQQIFSGTEKRWGFQTHSRSAAAEQSTCEAPVQDAYDQENPRASAPRGLVYVNRSERRLFSNTNSVPSQAILEIRLRGPGISIYSPTVRPVPSTPYIHEVHGRGSRTPETSGDASSELFGRLADSSSISIRAHRTQGRITRAPREARPHSQLGEKLAVSQPENFFSGNSVRLAIYDSTPVTGARTKYSARREILPPRLYSPAKKVSENAGPNGLSSLCTPAGPAPTADVAESASPAPGMDHGSISPQGRPTVHFSSETIGK